MFSLPQERRSNRKLVLFPSERSIETSSLTPSSPKVPTRADVLPRPFHYWVGIRPLSVATIHHLPQRRMSSIFPSPDTLSPRLTFRMPFGPSKTAVPPITLRTVQPLMEAGLVSGTATGRAESFARSTAVGAGESVVCFVGKETAVGARESVACFVGNGIALAS